LKDIKLDFVNKKIINQFIDKKERVIQQIKIAVNIWVGDWMLDEDFGINYDNSWGSQELMELYIKEQIKQVSGVNKIESFSIKKISNDTEQYFQIDTTIKFDGEVLEISEIIGV
jgi:copper chaperone CopZ